MDVLGVLVVTGVADFAVVTGYTHFGGRTCPAWIPPQRDDGQGPGETEFTVSRSQIVAEAAHEKLDSPTWFVP